MSVRAFLWVAALVLLAAGCGSDEVSGPVLDPIGTGSPSTSWIPGPSHSTEDVDVFADLREGFPVVSRESGFGWRLVGSAWYTGHSGVAVATSQRDLDRLWDRNQVPSFIKPTVDFATEVVVLLVPVVSGSCHGLVLTDFVVEPGHAYGLFEYPRPQQQVCTADANHVSFAFVVERRVLPSEFLLTVNRERPCPQCEWRGSLEVHLDDENALSVSQFGDSRLHVLLRGSPPAGDLFNVVGMHTERGFGALLHSAEEWPESVLGYDTYSSAGVVEGFVSFCGEEQCEECAGRECDVFEPVGELCRFEFVPVPYEDQQIEITFDELGCMIEQRLATAP